MQKKNIEVLRKILYAVESGGQVYGHQDYAAFVGAGANCSNEKAITIGAGQWYAVEAKKLLQKIQRANPAQFKKMDTQGITTDLLKKDWSIYAVAATSAKAKCIVSIINSELGRKCQDELMDEQITEYAASIVTTYGTMPDTAMMECINIIHQGGSAALKRILAKTAKPYTVKNIYDALNTDPDDPRTNQVGDYTTRQKKVYEIIVVYGDDGTEQKGEGTVSKTKLQEFTELGDYYANNGGSKPYLEKRTNAYLDDFQKNAGYNNYTKFARDVNSWGQPGCQGQPWCAEYQFWKLVNVLGITRALQIMGGGFYNCQSITKHAKANGTWHSTPRNGALIIFRNGSHVGSVSSFDSTYVYTNEGNTSSAAGVVANGGACRNKKYKRTDPAIDGYVWIDYGTDADQKSTETAKQLNKMPKWVGMVNTAKLNVRSWAGTENPFIKKYPYLAQNNLIDVCDTIKAADGADWYYVRIVNKYYGFVCAEFINRV
ncbi:MAG: CHAP domain-containing protein [Eubacteriales bacterium]|nr:CHAP domain-containing protein [Eubacteriales bacterium]